MNVQKILIGYICVPTYLPAIGIPALNSSIRLDNNCYLLTRSGLLARYFATGGCKMTAGYLFLCPVQAPLPRGVGPSNSKSWFWWIPCLGYVWPHLAPYIPILSICMDHQLCPFLYYTIILFPLYDLRYSRPWYV